MRVRHLQSHLHEQGLIQKDNLSRLSGFRVGIDAVFWLRSIQALKDPFADAIGGIPPGIFGFVDKELLHFERKNIKPLFVFQGMAPPPQHQMYINRLDSQMELAWNCLANGQRAEAQKCFAVSTSRINSDFVFFLFHHLRAKGYEVFQAPYFAGAQLAHFADQGLVNAVFGSPGLLLYGVTRCIIYMDFAGSQFDWLDLHFILQKWQVQLQQFIDACMLAGTEYCLTYPFLNVDQYSPGASNRFNFDAAIKIIRSAPLINWLQTFPTEEMKADHIEGYCTCKVLLKHSPVYDMSSGSVLPLSHCVKKNVGLKILGDPVVGKGNGEGGDAGKAAGDAEAAQQVEYDPKMSNIIHHDQPVAFAMNPINGQPRPEEARDEIPSDFAAVMGDMLPSGLYLLLCEGVISAKLPLALARGIWYDKSQPLLDTKEYRDLLLELRDYRQRSLGLIARHLHPKFQTKSVTLRATGRLILIKLSEAAILLPYHQLGASKMQAQFQAHITGQGGQGGQTNLLNPVTGGQQGANVNNADNDLDSTFLVPDVHEPMKWCFTQAEVRREMKRQNVEVVDFPFCLRWHWHTLECGKSESKTTANAGKKDSGAGTNGEDGGAGVEPKSASSDKTCGTDAELKTARSDQTTASATTEQGKNKEPASSQAESKNHHPEDGQQQQPLLTDEELKQSAETGKIPLEVLQRRRGLLAPADSKWTAKLPEDADKETLAAYLHMMMLESLDLLSTEGSMTVLGNVLKDTPRDFQEPCLVALELMKFGVLSGEAFDPAEEGRRFPKYVNYPGGHPKSHMLLARTISLVPMKLRNDMWNSHVDFDLAGFHMLIKILKRTLRQLTEACLASLLLPQLHLLGCKAAGATVGTGGTAAEAHWGGVGGGATAREGEGGGQGGAGEGASASTANAKSGDGAAEEKGAEMAKEKAAKVGPADNSRNNFTPPQRGVPAAGPIVGPHGGTSNTQPGSLAHPGGKNSAGILPAAFMCVTQQRDNHMRYPALLPAFPLPRACLGILTNYFLTYEGNAEGFRRDVSQHFGCCVQPVADLETGFAFWTSMKRAVDAIAVPLEGARELAADMNAADAVLRAQCHRLNLRIPAAD